MRTNVRITIGRSGNYDKLYMDILKPRYKNSPNSLETIATITWQGDDKFGWYAMNITMNTDIDDCHRFLTIYKLACYMKERSVTKQPAEIMGIIGGVEHFYHRSMYVSIEDNNRQLFSARKQLKDDSIYTYVIAANSIMAQRIIDGRISRNELENCTYYIKEAGERFLFTPTDLTHSSQKVNQSIN